MAERKTPGLDRFERLLDTYGARIARWPVDDREWAQGLIADSEDAHVLREGAAELDAMLDLAPAPEPSLELTANVLASADLSPSRRWAAALWPFGPIWKPVSMLVAAGVLGIMLGVVVPDSLTGTETPFAEEVDSLAAGTVLAMENDS